MYRVKSFESDEVLPGVASVTLQVAFEAEKRAHGPRERVAVPAYEIKGVWWYVRPEYQQQEMENGRDVVPVYLEELPS